MSSAFDAFSESLNTAAAGIDTLSEQTLTFPGQGKAADAFDAAFAAEKQALADLSEWAHTTHDAAQGQAGFDGKLEMAPTKADLTDAAAQLEAGTKSEDEVRDLTAEYKKAREDHNASTEGGQWDNVPSMPPTHVPGSAAPTTAEGAKPMDAQQSEGAPTADDPVAEGTDEAGADAPTEPADAAPAGPPSAGSGSSDTSSAAPLSADTVSTETSSDTATLPPTTGAGTGSLSGATQPQPTAGGQPITGTGGQPNASFGPTGGAPGQLSQSPQQARGGQPPQSPEKRREEQDKSDEREAVAHTAAGTATVAAAGVLGAASTVPTSNAGTPSVGTPTPAANAPAAPVGGGGGVGGVRPPNAAMGSGEQVSSSAMKPIYRAEMSELERELDEILGALTPDDKEPPK